MLKIELFKILCDGQFHSGTELGVQLQCSRSAIWKAVKSLKLEFNANIFSVRGRGYCLSNAIELLDKQLILNALTANAKKIVSNIDIFFSLDSTNDYLISDTKLNKYNNSICQICLAEYQYKGKGRRGKQWVSPIGGNIYCSLSWNFNKSFHELAGLSLAISVGVANFLKHYGVTEVELKWPNDILWQGKKLLGVLLEMHGEASGPCTTIIGIGINFNMKNLNVDIDQAWCDLNSILTTLPSRNIFTAHLLDNLINSIQLFEQKGLAAFLESWQQYDVIQDKEIIIKKLDTVEQGIARGIDPSGALLVEKNGQITALYSGDVSIRLSDAKSTVEST
ncbi:Biotin operon repressor / Biotin--protein ligase [hydrothermal vent metagenome]|uniref:Biotin operon repressor / Biotin--protein ligase n=1 Tax=hydrothermal vent metagenome TaxID=652676 RepID=A0A3B1B4A8_9ZZZZ